MLQSALILAFVLDVELDTAILASPSANSGRITALDFQQVFLYL